MNLIESRNAPQNVNHIYDGDRFEDLEIENSEDVLRGIDNILENYKIIIVNPPRREKKLLVVDVDYTLTCHDGTPRDFVDEMFTSVYEHYDIVLWTASTRDFLESRIKIMKLQENVNFKIAFCLEGEAMVPVFSWKFDDYIYVKALDLIWKKFPRYSVKNTIIFDDNWRNYALNKTCGLSTARYREVSCSTVRSELLRVAEYLKIISRLINLDIFDHNHWTSNHLNISRRGIKFFERAIKTEDETTMSALSPVPQIVLHLLSAIDLPDLPYQRREGHTSQKISKTLTFVEKDKTKNEIEKVDLVSPEVYSAEMTKNLARHEIKLLNPWRDGKKLLVLDLGYTLCDPEFPSFPSVKARRPHLSQLLTRAYRYYDIVIWSDMSVEDSSEALGKMGIINDDNYRIALHLTVREMIVVKTVQYGSGILKPLEFIWRKFPWFSSRNTVIIDDNRWYFAMNYQSGCEVKPYKVRNENLDVELEFLASYLEWIAFFEDFENLNHENWRCPKKVFIDKKKRIVQKRFRVEIEWPLNKLRFVNVPADVTVGELKYFIHETIGIELEQQVLLFNVPPGYIYEGGGLSKRDAVVFDSCRWEEILEKSRAGLKVVGKDRSLPIKTKNRQSL
ncbi:uncharacterized protein [Fopius arisanus]|uniref:Ublcp1 protein n=1 Tax=Fopius arisanus TaxID=64838 RepID=A0A0C9R0E3_9HYME|nr:PREDICTED: uncharacterized protein LOC105264408 [Fopius arisanus]